LTAWIEDSSRSFGLRIENTGEVAPQQLSRLYDEAGALIYPSFTESLGLPLLEARAHGLPIIASERDFVRDIVTPQQTFDPESALSIARAVRRFLGTAEPALQIRTPAEFLDFVQGG
jgi:glycosyltransferase involved in cell wall biosynthesis